MRSGDFLGDLGERRVVLPRIFEPVLGDGDGIGAAAPFADKTRAGLRLRLGVGVTRPVVRKVLAMVWSFRRVALLRPPCAIS